MNMQTAVKSVLGNYANFSGRARRSEYWYWTLAVFLLYVVGLIITEVAKPFAIILLLAYLAIIVPSLAVLWRRLHDTGRSGVWFLITFVPLVGGIILLVFACTDSAPGDNQYGPNPKGIGGYGGQAYGQPQYGQPQYGQPPQQGYGQPPAF